MDLVARIMIDVGCGTLIGVSLLLIYVQVFGGTINYSSEGLFPKLKRLKEERNNKE